MLKRKFEIDFLICLNVLFFKRNLSFVVLTIEPSPVVTVGKNSTNELSSWALAYKASLFTCEML
jgi:hypothetical protein